MSQKERTERYKAAQDDRGLVQVKVWVPEPGIHTIKLQASILRQEWAAYKGGLADEE